MNYVGHWKCRIHTPVGAQDMILVVECRDGVLRGQSRGDEFAPLTNLRVEDGRLRWTQQISKPMRLTIAFDVLCDGDSLSGTAKPGILPKVKVEGRRVDDASLSDAAPTSGASAAPLMDTGPAAGAPRSNWPVISVDPRATGGRRIEVGMLAFPGMTALDLIGPHAVLSGPTSVRLIAKRKEILVTDTGISITPDLSIDEAPFDLDVLFVPGGPGQVDVMQDDETLAFLADRGSRARFVTSACTGSLILGAAGLLRGYRATTHWAALDLLRVFGAEPVADRVVIDRNRMTGGGVTAGIDFGLVLLDALFGDRVARTMQLLMEYAPAPPFNAGRPEDAGEDLVAEALQIMTPVASETMQVISNRFAPQPIFPIAT